MSRRDFREELRELINKHNIEAGSATPDFMLTQFITEMLNSLEFLITARDNWYGEKTGAKTPPKIEAVALEHGKNCEKIGHTGEGHIHSASDDQPFDVDGCKYCGRCHRAL